MVKFFKRKSRLGYFCSKYSGFWAVLLFALALGLFGYLKLINEPPQSTHLWRQSDSVSFAKNYYNDGEGLFKPKLHSLQSDQGTTGYAVAEFPILYYVIGKLYHVFGENYWLFRLVWSLIFILGFYALFKIFILFNVSPAISFFSAYLVFSTPLLVFYGNSFLPEVPALSFTLLGWLMFANWYKSDEYKYLIYAALFFLLGGLIKVTALISIVAVVCVWVLEVFGVKIRSKEEYLFKHRTKAILPFLSVVIIAFIWYSWAKYFNATHDASYFSTSIRPIWKMSQAEIQRVWYLIGEFWLEHFFTKAMLTLYLISIIGVFYLLRHVNRLLLVVTSLLFIGVSINFVLWFIAYGEHDYYFIVYYILPPFLLLTFFNGLQKKYNKIFVEGIVVTLLLLIAIVNTKYAVEMQDSRYKGFQNDYFKEFADFYKVAPFLDELGIAKEDYVISVPDMTPNYSLQILNRKGWTMNSHSGKFAYGHARDSVRVEKCIASGAKYLFISNYNKTLQEYSHLKYFTHNLIGEYNNLKVFRLDTIKHPFSLEQKNDTLFYMICDAEEISKKDSNLLLTNIDSITCMGGGTHSNTVAFSGNSSILLNSKNPYGFTTTFPVSKNTIVEARVWRRPENVGSIVFSGSKGSDLYYSTVVASGQNQGEWEEVLMKITLGSEAKEQSITAYIWNNKEVDAYFDDFEICVYKKNYVIQKRCTKE